MKRNTKIAAFISACGLIVVLLLIAVMAVTLSGCAVSTEADVVNHNLSKEAEYFNCERRVTVYNARTDTIVMQAEGFMDISNNSYSELVITVKTGPETYRKNYIYLNEYTMYVVEDITGTHTDPYDFKVYFHKPFNIDVEPAPYD